MLNILHKILLIVGVWLCCLGTTPLIVRFGAVLLLISIVMRPVFEFIHIKYRRTGNRRAG